MNASYLVYVLQQKNYNLQTQQAYGFISFQCSFL